MVVKEWPWHTGATYSLRYGGVDGDVVDAIGDAGGAEWVGSGEGVAGPHWTALVWGALRHRGVPRSQPASRHIPPSGAAHLNISQLTALWLNQALVSVYCR